MNLRKIKKTCYFLLVYLFSPGFLFVPSLYPVQISTYLYTVDGVLNNTEVVTQGRLPIFSWEYTATASLCVSSFTLNVSTESALPFTSTIWSVITTTGSSSINTATVVTGSEYRTSVQFNYNGTAFTGLKNNTTYYWSLTLYDSAGSSKTLPCSPAPAMFATVLSSAVFTGPNYDLQVDYNNPFNPSKGQVTKFRYIVKDRNRSVKVRVYTLSGSLVKILIEGQTALKDREYTLAWDGKDYD